MASMRVHGSMKAISSTRHAFILAALLNLSVLPVRAQIPANATITIVPATASSNRMTLADPGDHVWVLQSSADFATWTEIGTWKIHNGSFHRALARDANEKIFYRAFFDPARQDIFSTTANALRLPLSLPNYSLPLPPHYIAPPVRNQDNTPTNNPVTDAGATLGRVLFYDKRLSTNGTVSCSSCHQQQAGFSDSRRFSLGFQGGLTGRNSMGLSNARYYTRGAFFWDERATTLEDQVLQPIQNSVEMGMTLPALVTRLTAEPFYTNLFASAFGTAEVNTNRISRALAQFVRSMVSTRSKYDAAVAVGFTNFTAQEMLGRQIFLGQVGNATCVACHGTDAHTAPTINNNGLEFPYVDSGVGGITGRAQENGLFKVPSLRNIELTAPYMHDGRFATLEEVVEFYNSGVVLNPNLPPPLRAPPVPGQPPAARRLNLTANEKAALVAFLKTLTDRNLTTDSKFSDPFNYGD
jgi:cytochrome c peroxidase